MAFLEAPQRFLISRCLPTEVERRRLERLRSGEMEARATESVLEGLAAEVIDGRGIALVLRPHESAVAVSATYSPRSSLPRADAATTQ